MTSNDTKPATSFPAPCEEVYLPPGGTDPDFYIPAEGERRERRSIRWIRRHLRFFRRTSESSRAT